MEPAATSKKRSRSSAGSSNDSIVDEEPPTKKQTPGDGSGAPTSIKKSAAISSDAFRSPLRDVEPSTISIQKARDILAYAQLGDPRSFKLAVKETFSFLALSPRNQEYIQTYLALIYVGKTAWHYFHLPQSSEQEPNAEMWHFLLEQLSPSVTDLKRASELAVLACNLLSQAFQEKVEWPIEFVQAFLEDSFGKRLWVDDESARSFVCGVLSVTPKDRASETFLAEDDHKSQSSTSTFGSPYLTNQTTRSGYLERYSDQNIRDRVSNYVSQLIEFHLATLNAQDLLFPAPNASASDGLKSLIRTLSLLMPYAHIRPVAARYLDAWFANAQSARHAKDLFRRMSINTVDVSSTDVDVVRLVLRYKTVPTSHSPLFYEMLSLLASQQAIFRTKLLQDLVSDLLVQEISAQSIGSKALGRLLESSLGIDNEASLASVVHELALDPKFGPQLKVLIPLLLSYHPQTHTQSATPIAKHLNIPNLCTALTSPYCELSNLVLLPQTDPSLIAQWCNHIADTLMSLLIFSVPKVLYEQASTGGMISNIAAQREEAGRSFAKNLLQPIQTAAVEWCQRILPSYLGTTTSQLLPALLRRILLMDPISSAYYLGNIALSADQLNALAQTLYSSPISENMFLSLLLCGSGPTPSISETETLDILELLLIRTLRMQNGYDLLPDITNPSCLVHLFGLAAIQAPESQLELTTGETIEIRKSSSLCWTVRQRAWKANGLLLLCASSKPATTGALAWDNIPMAKILMQMILTRTWSASAASDPQIRQLYVESAMEEARIRPVFENILQQTTPGMLSWDLLLFDPFSTVCEPPSTFLAWIRELDAEFKLSRLLFKNRNPDFVSDLLKKDQLKATRWLAPLIAADQSMVTLLPSKCLSILLIASQAIVPSDQIPTIPPQTLTRTILKNLETETTSSMASACTVWQFILNFLSSDSSHIRLSTHRALSKMLCDSETTFPSGSPSEALSPFNWLQFIDSIPYYKAMTDIIDEAVIQSIKIENDADRIARMFEFLKSCREASNGGKMTANDLIFMNDIIDELLSTSSARKDAVLRHNDLLKIFTEIVAALLVNPITAVSHPSQSIARWNLTPGTSPSNLSTTVFKNTATILAMQSVFFDSASFEASYLAPLAVLMSNDSHGIVEHPIGIKHTPPIEFFKILDSDLFTRLQGTSSASHYFQPKVVSNEKMLHPIDRALIVAQQQDTPKLSTGDILAICGFTEDEDASDGDFEAEKMEIDQEAKPRALDTLNEASLELFFSKETSSLAHMLQSAQLETSSIDDISNFNQAVIRATTHLPRSTEWCAQVERWHQTLRQWHHNLTNLLYASQKDRQHQEDRLRRLAQEIAILQPFTSQPASNPIITSETHTQSLLNCLPADLSTLAGFVPNSTTFAPADAKHACAPIITFLQHSLTTDSSTTQLEPAVSWLVKLAAICDFSPLIDFSFTQQPESHKFHALKSLFVEVIHREGSWKAKENVLDILLGPTGSSMTSSASTISNDAFSFDSESKGAVEMLPIQQIEISLGLKFLTLFLESNDGKSWSDHISSMSNKVSTPLKDRPASLLNLTKSQLLRLVGLIMMDLTHEQVDHKHEIAVDPRLRVSQRASMLLACCNMEGSKHDEMKVSWLIEAISQTPNAHSMNIMRWMDDMTRSSLVNGTSMKFRPDQLVLRFGSSNPLNKMESDENRHFETKTKPMTVDEACESLLMNIYFESPWQVFSIIKHFTNRVSATNEHSKLDYKIHRLLKKLLQETNHDSELLVLRTFALSHPAFIIKFLPTMSALLNGRTQVGPEEFLQQKNDEIFVNVLGVLEMLVPLIFHDKMAKHFLPELLDEYFKLLLSIYEGNLTKRSGRAISLTSQDSNLNPEAKWFQNERIKQIIVPLSNFLAAYCTETLLISEALAYLQPHLDVLISTSNSIPELRSLKKVVHCLQSKSAIGELEPALPISDIQAMKALLSPYSDLNQLWGAPDREEKLLQIQETLHRLEQTICEKSASTSSTPYHDCHKVSILNYLINYILPMMQWSPQLLQKPKGGHPTSSSAQAAHSSPALSPFISHAIDRIRRSSLAIAAIYIQTFPREGERIISSFLTCLRSLHGEIRQDALPYAKPVCLSCIFHAQQVDLMMALFAMGKIGQNSLRDILAVLSDLM